MGVGGRVSLPQHPTPNTQNQDLFRLCRFWEIVMDIHFSGIITPLATPLDSHGNIDRESLARLIGWQIDKGVHGIFVLGTNGEGNLLLDDQKRDVVRVASECVNGTVPLVCGVSDVSLPRVIGNMDRIADIAFDGYVSTLPYYCITNAEEQSAFFAAVCGRADRPVLAYNIPSFVKSDIALSVIEKMASHERFAGVKESGADMARYKKLMSIKSEHPELSFFTGCSHLMDVAYSLGYDGGVVGLANVTPTLCSMWHTLYMRGDDDGAKAVQAAILRVLDRINGRRAAYGQATTLAVSKAILKALGIIRESAMVAPYGPVHPDRESEISEMCELICAEESALAHLRSQDYGAVEDPIDARRSSLAAEGRSEDASAPSPLAGEACPERSRRGRGEGE